MGNRWATTEEVANAGRVTPSAVMKWAGKGVLPTYVVTYGGRRGRSARWPLEAPAQASWVRAQLDAGLSFEEIREALARGEFRA
jgi:DNA-binding transcriptional MerR regulator